MDYEHPPKADWLTVAVVVGLALLLVGGAFLAWSERTGRTQAFIEAVGESIYAAHS